MVTSSMHDAGLLVIPADQLGPAGPDDSFRRQVAELHGPDERWFRLLDEALKLYDERLRELSSRAPEHWFPPRRQHLCVILKGSEVRPYFQPFHGSSWLVHESDFDPERSTPEFAAFQIAQAERLGIVRDVVSGFVCNLSWCIGRRPQEVAEFVQACNATERPDAEGYRAMAAAMTWLTGLDHEVLSPPKEALPGSVTIPGTGLVLTSDLRPRMDALVKTWAEAVRGVADRHYRRQAELSGPSHTELFEWLEQRCPQLVITGSENEILWSPDEPSNLERIKGRLLAAPPSAIASMQADLEVVDDRSGAFRQSLTHPDELPAPEERTADQDGLCYMHLDRGLIAYNIEEVGMQRMREAAPPFERAMLAARTIHEWGHLAASAGWIDVPARLQQEFDQRLSRLGATYDAVLGAAPKRVLEQCETWLDRLARGEPSRGMALARLTLARVEDFQANLLSRRFLDPVELETYVRNNVRSLVYEYGPESVFERLARYAYEFQYLRFSAMEDARGFLLRTTWIPEQYLSPGILDLDLLEALLRDTAALCDLYVVDEQWFKVPDKSSAR